MHSYIAKKTIMSSNKGSRKWLTRGAMSIFSNLKIKKCPCCQAVNLIPINGMTYKNKFKIFSGWIVKKIFNCRKCKEELGVFIRNSMDFEEKIVWLKHLRCEEHYYERLQTLEERKNKLAKIQNKKYYQTLKDIEDIQNNIRSDILKLKVKFKIQRRGMLIRSNY